MDKILLFILPALANIIHAISHACHDLSYEKKEKTKLYSDLFHYTSVVSIMLFVLSGAIIINFPWYFIGLQLVLTRLAFFDYVNNAIQGMSLGHRGSSPIWDKFLKSAKMSEAFFVMVRILALVFSFVIIYKWL